MDGILEWGYPVITWLQQFSPTLDVLFKSITQLGSEQAFLLLLPLIFWCVDKRHGARLGLLLITSTYINAGLKNLFDQPRPSPTRVKVLTHESSPGLPSGHSQNSVAVYGLFARLVRRPGVRELAGIAILSVGLSRIYLGVHFPSDVLAGWLIGALLLTLFVWVEPLVTHQLRAWSWEQKMALAIALPLAVFLASADEVSAQLMGTLLGLMVGILVELRWVGFSAQGPLRQRALRFVVGGTVLVALWAGSKALVPSAPETVAHAARLIRYLMVGAWASLGAPWLFVRSGLAIREDKATASP